MIDDRKFALAVSGLPYFSKRPDINHACQLLFVRIQEIEVKNPGDFIKSRRFSRHGKKSQNYDFWLTNKSVNSYITQKST